jgi:hypothetical protein
MTAYRHETPPRAARADLALRRVPLDRALDRTRGVDDPARTRRRLPNLLLAGVTHAGAAGLARDLAEHPQVHLPAGRRIDHFTPLRYGRTVDRPLEDYAEHFSGWRGQRYRLDCSPVSFDGGRRLVQAVDGALPGLRVLIVLRDPAERLWASYTDKVASGRLPRAMTYETFVERCLALRANGTDRYEGNRYFRTLSSGFYTEHLPLWLDAFGPRVRVVFAEDLRRDPAQALADVAGWLDLDPGGLPPAPADPDGATVAAPRALHRVRAALSLLMPGSGDPAGSAGTAGAVQRPGDRMLNRVRCLYAGGNRELAALLRDRGRTDLPAWLQG